MLKYKGLDFMEVEETGHLKTALEAIRLLIVEKLDSNNRTRFASVASLCEVAQSLMRAEAKPQVPREDEKYAEDEEGPNFVGGFEGNVVMGAPMMYQDTPKEARRRNNIQMSVLSQVTIETQRAQWASAEAQELKDLMAIRGNIVEPNGRGALEARIRELLKNIKDRTEHADVVHSELSRGHSTGGSKSDGDVHENVQPLERGVEGAGDLSEKSS